MIHTTSLRSTPIFLLALGFAACRPAPPDVANGATRPDTITPSSPPTANTDMRVSGTIHSVNIEGGCWRFDAANGTKYEILKSSAPSGLLEDGKQVTLTVKPRPELMSTCQVGPILEVVTVES
ncbi:MAG: hypothetical protein ABI679_09385 [Gemmatimonadota bacterium]